jgi:hypothetical protein
MTPNGFPPPLACGNCGAPDDGQEVVCKFCKQAVSPQVLASAIPCGQCNHPNRWGRQQCLRCNAWLVVQCVFCSALSPRTMPACMQCHEVFAGSWERKQAAAGQQQIQQAEEVLGTVAAIAGGVLLGGLGRRW